MKSRYSFPTSTDRKPVRSSRRGFTLVEVAVVAGLLVMLIATAGGILSGSTRIFQRTMLQTAADQHAVRSVQRMIMDIREAKKVDILGPNHIRIYYPVSVTSTQYDRSRLDATHYVDYAETTPGGTITPGGGCLWRKTESEAGWAAATGVSQFNVTAFSASAVQLTVRIDKGFGNYRGMTTLNEKVIYLRNY